MAAQTLLVQQILLRYAERPLRLAIHLATTKAPARRGFHIFGSGFAFAGNFFGSNFFHILSKVFQPGRARAN